MFEVVCTWLREKEKVELESRIREYYPILNSGNYLDRDRNKIVVVKEQIKTVQVRQNMMVSHLKRIKPLG